MLAQRSRVVGFRRTVLFEHRELIQCIAKLRGGLSTHLPTQRLGIALHRLAILRFQLLMGELAFDREVWQQMEAPRERAGFGGRDKSNGTDEVHRLWEKGLPGCASHLI